MIDGLHFHRCRPRIKRQAGAPPPLYSTYKIQTLNINNLFSTWWRRLGVASLLWVLFWPIFWYFRIGEITGPKSWFWIVGELNYPFAAIFFYLADGFFSWLGFKAWKLFIGAVLMVAVIMPFFYQRAGFSFGVLLEAHIF